MVVVVGACVVVVVVVGAGVVVVVVVGAAVVVVVVVVVVDVVRALSGLLIISSALASGASCRNTLTVTLPAFDGF